MCPLRVAFSLYLAGLGPSRLRSLGAHPSFAGRAHWISRLRSMAAAMFVGFYGGLHVFRNLEENMRPYRPVARTPHCGRDSAGPIPGMVGVCGFCRGAAAGVVMHVLCKVAPVFSEACLGVAMFHVVAAIASQVRCGWCVAAHFQAARPRVCMHIGAVHRASAHRGARAHDHKVMGLALCRLS